MSDASPLHLSVSRSGGFAGTARTYHLDASRLSPEHLVRLRGLVEDLHAQPGDAAAPGAPDTFQYVVTIREGEIERTVRGGEGSDVQPLVDFVRDNA